MRIILTDTVERFDKSLGHAFPWLDGHVGVPPARIFAVGGCVIWYRVVIV